MKLKLDRTSEVIAEVPDDAQIVVDMQLEVRTKKLWDVTEGRYRTYFLRGLKVWVKQSDGSFKLESWPWGAIK